MMQAQQAQQQQAQSQVMGKVVEGAVKNPEVVKQVAEGIKQQGQPQ